MSGQDTLQYRGRLDRTLASHDLANEEALKSLVKNHIQRSSGHDVEEYINNVLETRTNELSNFLGMLRSASVSHDEGLKSSETPSGGWKVKQDTQEYRVMYREGPAGTPFHSLLVEGYIDGPIDVCRWPQSTVPTFKIISSECLQKVRIGEQISLVRMKLSWPLSGREAVVHYYVFEYFQDDLIIVLIKSISDLESIDRSTHGFTKDGIPDEQDVVRIDLVGGFALQKVTSDRSYFRTIMNMDIKLNFVPPAFINFISRQLIGSGFRLYQKEVASVSQGDEQFGKALKDPLYTRIREALYKDERSEGAQKPEDFKSDTCTLPEEHLRNSVLAESHMETDQRALVEIEEIMEEDVKGCESVEEDKKKLYKSPTNEVIEGFRIIDNRKVVISPEVEQALGTLEKVVSVFREHGYFNERFLKSKRNATKESKSSEDSKKCSNREPSVELSESESMEMTPHDPRNSSCSHGSRFSNPMKHRGPATAVPTRVPISTYQHHCPPPPT
ncbi:hypothetical protein RJ640_000853 [Escallonia rubra]|uniref:START domain-containing protein n=1 Tax=Escallonia rubra TaxID=112253 RepID=A0AA88RUY6_9ASTE|nr:hypothetical protein RJ640_000853 [Escallonia rubra]